MDKTVKVHQIGKFDCLDLGFKGLFRGWIYLNFRFFFIFFQCILRREQVEPRLERYPLLKEPMLEVELTTLKQHFLLVTTWPSKGHYIFFSFVKVRFFLQEIEI